MNIISSGGLNKILVGNPDKTFLKKHGEIYKFCSTKWN